jgi:putative ABC transport system permease protein
VAAEAWEARYRGDEEDGDARLSSERNLTWMADLPPDNRVVSGSWWEARDVPPSGVEGAAAGIGVSGEGVSASRALVSLEDEYAEERGLEVGDVLTFDIAGTLLEAEVANLRRLNWESMRPNFFIIFSPGALDGYPATYTTSFHLDRAQKPFLNRLLSRFPTVTVIEIDAIIAQVQSIIARVTQAVELVLGLVLAAGCLVLVASIQASRDARMHEHALVRTLGGTRRLIAGSLAAEFALLGLFAGVVAVVGAELTVAVLQRQVFELGMDIHPWLWLIGPVVGAVLILTVGLLGTRSLISTPPMLVLRGLN